MQSVTLALPASFQLDQFRVESVLGKGGFGITYVATDLRLNKKVALKELLPDSIVTRVAGNTVVPHSQSSVESWEWAKERFLDEAKTLAAFSHPAIVGVHHYLEANGTAYMVMDFVDGESYESRLRRIGRESDEGSLMAVVGPIMDGLAEVHAKKLLHRDIKPENILINHRGQPVLIDFGAAREVVGATVAVTSIVTHGYSPFEQYQSSAKLGPSSDVYSIGAVMCRAVSGEKPPVATERVLEDHFTPLATRKLEGFSIGFLDCIDRALAVRAESRPQSIAEFKADIHGQQGTIKLQPRSIHTPLAMPPPIPAYKSSSKKNHTAPLLVVAALILVLCVGFWGVMALSKKNNSDSTVHNTKSVPENSVPPETISVPPPSAPAMPESSFPQATPLPHFSGNQKDINPIIPASPSEPTSDFLTKEKLFQAKQNIKAGFNTSYSIEDRNLIISRLSPMLANSKNPTTRSIAERDITQHSRQLDFEKAFLQKSIQTIRSIQKSDNQIVELAWIEFKNEANLSLASKSPEEREFTESILITFADRIGYSYP